MQNISFKFRLQNIVLSVACTIAIVFCVNHQARIHRPRLKWIGSELTCYWFSLFLLCLESDYAVKEKPLMGEDMLGGADYIVLKTLDTDGVRIIGSVLGQSIALDYFVSQVNKVFIIKTVTSLENVV